MGTLRRLIADITQSRHLLGPAAGSIALYRVELSKVPAGGTAQRRCQVGRPTRAGANNDDQTVPTIETEGEERACSAGPAGVIHRDQSHRHGRHPGERYRRSVAGRRPASRSTIAAWLSVHARGSSPRTTWTGATLTCPFRPGRRRSGDGPSRSPSVGRGRPLEVEHLADGEARGRPWCRPTGGEGGGTGPIYGQP